MNALIVIVVLIVAMAVSGAGVFVFRRVTKLTEKASGDLVSNFQARLANLDAQTYAAQVDRDRWAEDLADAERELAEAQRDIEANKQLMASYASKLSAMSQANLELTKEIRSMRA